MGRPRIFEVEDAIETATALFWRKGYDGTSLTDLTKAMKITAPSFYFAFGSKENLFKKAMERYDRSCGIFIERALQEPTARAVTESFLYSYVDLITDPAHAPGCLGMNSALPLAEGDEVKSWLAGLREKFRVKLHNRFTKARKSGDLSKDSDPDALARFIAVLTWGMAIEAQSGASRKDLLKMIAPALALMETKSS